MKYFVYVLKSRRLNKFYTGMTKDLHRRLKEHNSGRTKSNKAFIPWEIIYTEEFNSEEEALKREKYLKSGSGREFLRKIKLKSEYSDKF